MKRMEQKNNIKVAIHQPDYIPYLGFFYKMWQVEKFVYLDDCQFSNVNWHHWNRIKTPQGECRLKIPVEQHLGDLINCVRTKDELGWKDKHLKTIEMNYGKTKYFKVFFEDFKELLMPTYKSIADMNMEINTFIAKKFGFGNKITYAKSSDMSIQTFREERVLDICNKLNGDIYISGNGARAYEDEEHFKARGLQLIYTDYQAIEYLQAWGEFIPNLSVIDFICNCGYDWDLVLKKVKEKQQG